MNQSKECDELLVALQAQGVVVLVICSDELTELIRCDFAHQPYGRHTICLTRKWGRIALCLPGNHTEPTKFGINA